MGGIFLWTERTTLEPGTGNAKQSGTDQYLDEWGNLASSYHYDYNNFTTAARVYSYSYLSGTEYASRNIRNRLTAASVSGFALAANTYDVYTGAPCLGLAMVLVPANRTGNSYLDPRQHDSGSYGTSFTYRGNPGVRTQGGVTTCVAYDITGTPYQAADALGAVAAYDVNSNTNYGAPSKITPNSTSSLAVNLGYNGWLGLTSVSGPNGANASTGYDSLGRPISIRSPHDEAGTAITNITYTLNTQTATTGSRWTRKTLDGLGRVVKEERGDGSGTKSTVDTEYDRCPCSPLGKVKRVSQPYAPGGTVYWTTYTYDALGRTLTVTLPNGTGTTTYSYQGNAVTVTDPAGRWKTTVYDAFGNIAQVIEPDPNAGNVTTSYTYNALGLITRVEMPRGGVTQVRTFSYNSAGRLTSKTEPESGTTNYTYNADGTLASKTDARNQTASYSYDTNKRMTAKLGATLYYDTNPFGTSEYTAGRLAAAVYAGAEGRQIRESYGYTRGGRLKWKQLTVLPGTDEETTLGASWEWDNEGRMTRATYPLNEAVYGYSYDTMGRLSTASTTGPQWGQAYAYDGWGNLAGKTVTKGSGPVFGVSYDGLTNRQNGLTYDAAGNVLMSNVYDAEERMVSYGDLLRYGYDPSNRRVHALKYGGTSTQEEVVFYGPGGERMGTYRRAVELLAVR